MNLDIFLTKQCNMRCEFCGAYIEKTPPKLSVEEIDQILTKGKAYGFRYTTFSGGEPLLYTSLSDALAAADKNGFWVNLTTNGALIDQKFIDSVKGKNVNLRVSLHTLNPKTHVEMTQTDTLQRVLEGIDLLKNNGMYYSIGCTIFDKNFDEMETIADFAFENHAAYIRFSPVVRQNKGSNYPIDKNFYHRSLKKILKMTLRYQPYLYYEKPLFPINPHFLSMMTTRRCAAGTKSFMIVDSEKNLLPCQFLPPESFGLKIKTIDDLNTDFETMRLNMIDYFKSVQAMSFQGECKECLYLDTCQGGCFATRLTSDTGALNEQPVCLYAIVTELFSELNAEEQELILNYWSYHYNQRISSKGKIHNCVRKLPIWELNFRMDRLASHNAHSYQ